MESHNKQGRLTRYALACGGKEEWTSSNGNFCVLLCMPSASAGVIRVTAQNDNWRILYAGRSVVEARPAFDQYKQVTQAGVKTEGEHIADLSAALKECLWWAEKFADGTVTVDGCTVSTAENAKHDMAVAHAVLSRARTSMPSVTYTLAEIRNGTGWPVGVRFQVVQP